MTSVMDVTYPMETKDGDHHIYLHHVHDGNRDKHDNHNNEHGDNNHCDNYQHNFNFYQNYHNYNHQD